MISNARDCAVSWCESHSKSCVKAKMIAGQDLPQHRQTVTISISKNEIVGGLKSWEHADFCICCRESDAVLCICKQAVRGAGNCSHDPVDLSIYIICMLQKWCGHCGHGILQISVYIRKMSFFLIWICQTFSDFTVLFRALLYFLMIYFTKSNFLVILVLASTYDKEPKKLTKASTRN